MTFKHIITSAIAVMMACTAVSAQNSDYNRITIGYDANMLSGRGSRSFNEDGKNGATLSGFSLQYTHGFSLMNTAPLYLETGLRLNAVFNSNFLDTDDSEDEDEIKAKNAKMSLVVPLNVAYKINCGNNFAITPYTGFHIGFNLLGTHKLSYSGDNEYIEEYVEEYGTINWFSKKDVDDKDYRWSRIQAGWQIGLNMNVSNFCFGLEYSLDFNSLAKKLNTSDLYINLGVCF